MIRKAGGVIRKAGGAVRKAGEAAVKAAAVQDCSGLWGKSAERKVLKTKKGSE